MAQTGPFLARDGELAAQLEATWAVSPGALAATDFFKHTSTIDFQRVLQYHDRENDRDNAQASVISTTVARKSAKWSMGCELIPAGSASPTAPDIKNFLEAHFGTKHVATAHTTTTAGSAGTSIVLVGGGGAASGIAVGDMIAIDQDGAGNYEVRQVVTVATDTITVDRAFTTANVATGRAVKVGATFRLSATTLKSLNLWSFINGNNFRHNIPGAIVQNLGIDVSFANQDPVGQVKVDGIGQKLTTHSTGRPTPTTVGSPLVPSKGQIWLGAALWSCVSVGIKSNNGITLRQNDSSSLFPSGMKRTENKSRYKITQSIDALLVTGTPMDGDGLFDNVEAATAYDAIVQLGVTPGQIVAWRTPKWIPQVMTGEQDGEFSLKASGRLYGTSGDDELTLAFL